MSEMTVSFITFAPGILWGVWRVRLDWEGDTRVRLCGRIWQLVGVGERRRGRGKGWTGSDGCRGGGL